jgi:hypothetical protein
VAKKGVQKEADEGKDKLVGEERPAERRSARRVGGARGGEEEESKTDRDF